MTGEKTEFQGVCTNELCKNIHKNPTMLSVSNGNQSDFSCSYFSLSKLSVNKHVYPLQSENFNQHMAWF